MTWKLSARSMRNLDGVNADLVRVVRVIQPDADYIQRVDRRHQDVNGDRLGRGRICHLAARLVARRDASARFKRITPHAPMLLAGRIAEANDPRRIRGR